MTYFRNELDSIQGIIAQLMAGAATTQTDTMTNTEAILSKSSTNETVSQQLTKAQEPTTPTTAAPPASEWVTIARRSKAPIPERKRLAAARAFAPPQSTEAPNGYVYVYIPRARRMDRKSIRNLFQNLGIDPVRILDISFPARSVISILIHAAYHTEFLAALTGAKVRPLENFNPLDPKHIADPQFADMAPNDRTRLAAAIHQDRCFRILYFLRPYLVPSVSKYFVAQQWISEPMATSIIQDRIPRHSKRTKIDTSTATAAFLATTGRNTKTQRYDTFGNPVESQDMEITEEYAANAHDDESSSDKEQDPATNHNNRH
jgi:hypothetical protein